MVFSDPPYNVPIQGHVGGSGSIKHREFAMAAGEMSKVEFTGFLTTSLRNMADASLDGSIHFVCMDWRHMDEVLQAGEAVYSEFKNLIVWVKDNGGMGTFYRSRHELIFAFKNGTAPHINSFELGQNGRYRTNVWQYKGVNTLKAGRLEELALHPTVKPVQMIADAIKDVSARGGIVLDLFRWLGFDTDCGAQDRATRLPLRTRPDLLRSHHPALGSLCQGLRREGRLRDRCRYQVQGGCRMSGPDPKHQRALAVRPTATAYEVGYAKPPAETRFKPGQSGNPRGRAYFAGS